jgi:FlaA1/EpsC-like NDP-sugar epimerase
MTSERVAAVLGRQERRLDSAEPLGRLAGQRVLVTGAEGSLGVELVTILRLAGIDTVATDLHGTDRLDVRDATAVLGTVQHHRPVVIVHLAGAKHAPDGELDPFTVTMTNAIGTANLVEAVRRHGGRLVTASTGKAADPETAYGASKLLAERLTLQAGHTVARFHNVIESSGNVFEIWDAVPADRPLPVAPCERYFITLHEAVSLLLWATMLHPGRYMIDSGSPRAMNDVAAAYAPGRRMQLTTARRGDRVIEPRQGASEAWRALLAPRGIVPVTSPHENPVPATVKAAA